MTSLNSLTLAELRQHEFHTDASHARLAAVARRRRRPQPRLTWLRRIAGRRPQPVSNPSLRRAAVTSIARPRSGEPDTVLRRIDRPDAA